MPGTIMATTGFTDLHDARFRMVFDDKYDGFDTYYEKVLGLENSDKSYEQYTSVGGHTLMTEKDKAAIGDTDSRIQGYDTTFTNRTFTLGAEIEYENIKDDQFRVLDGEAKVLAKSAKRTPDVHAADALKRGFSTTDSYGGSMLAADGIRHFSTLHYKNPDETGTTYSNASSTGVVLSDDNLETGITAVEEQLNDRAILAGCRARTLVVPTALKKTALIITGSDKRSETADNDANVRLPYFQRFYGGTLDVVVWPELGAVTTNGSDTAWYLLDDSEVHELVFQWRERPNVLGVEFDKKKLVYEYTCLARYEFGMVDWRGTWGSAGDGSSYSS